MDLQLNAIAVVKRYYPDFDKHYKKHDWQMFDSIGRVYVNNKACKELGWKPKYDFQHILNCLESGVDYRSKITQLISSKGYHEQIFEDGPYPV